MKVLSPFGPKIAKLKFSNKLIKKINNEVDQILNKKSLLKKLDYSKKLVGQAIIGAKTTIVLSILVIQMYIQYPTF